VFPWIDFSNAAGEKQINCEYPVEPSRDSPKSFKMPKDAQAIVIVRLKSIVQETKGAGFSASMLRKPEVAFEMWKSLPAVSVRY
jgi:hypothetical protein